MFKIKYFVITLTFFFLIQPFFLFSKEKKLLPKTNIASHAKFEMINAILNGNHIIELKLSPIFRIDKFFMALDFPFQINLSENNSIYNAYLYTNPSHYLQWIYQIAYGTPKDSYEYKIGTIRDLKLGQGSLMNHFYNDTLLDDKGAYARQDFNHVSYSLFLSNIANGSFGGIDINIKPFKAFIENPVIEKITFGASFIYDIDNQQIPYKDNINLNLNERNPDSERVLAYSFNVELPFYDNLKFRTGLTYEYAGLIDQKQSSHYFKLFFHTLNYQFNMGGAYLQNGYFFNLFSTLYLNPSERKDRIHQFGNKDGFAYYIGQSLSFFDEYLTAKLDISGQTQGSFSYLIGFDIKPGLLSQLLLSIFYVKENSTSTSQAIDILNMDNVSTLLKISYLFSDNARMMLQYKNTFRYRYKDLKTLNNSELSFSIALLL